MASLASLPVVGFCPKKKALADLFVVATHDLVTLHYAEVEALTQGTSLDRFELAIQRARDRRTRSTATESPAIQAFHERSTPVNVQPLAPCHSRAPECEAEARV